MAWTRARAARYRTGVLAFRAVILGALNAKLTVDAVGKLPDSPSVIATNHLSYIDAFTVGLALQEQGRTPIFMVRSTVADTWLIGGFLRAGAVLVDAASVDSSKRAWQEAIWHLRDGRDIIVAPEHAISRSCDLLPLKTGAVRVARNADVPLVPAINFGSQRFFTATHDPAFRPAYNVPLHVTFGAPIHVGQGKPAEATERLRFDLEALLDETLNSYEDREEGEGGEWWWPHRRGGGAVKHDVALTGHLINRPEDDRFDGSYIDVDTVNEIAAALADLGDLEDLSDEAIAAEFVGDLNAAAAQLGTAVTDPSAALTSMLSTLNFDLPVEEDEPGPAIIKLDLGTVEVGIKAERPDGYDLPEEVHMPFRLTLVDPDGPDTLLNYATSTPSARSQLAARPSNTNEELATQHPAVRPVRDVPYMSVIDGGVAGPDEPHGQERKMRHDENVIDDVWAQLEDLTHPSMQDDDVSETTGADVALAPQHTEPDGDEGDGRSGGADRAEVTADDEQGEVDVDDLGLDDLDLGEYDVGVPLSTETPADDSPQVQEQQPASAEPPAEPAAEETSGDDIFINDDFPTGQPTEPAEPAEPAALAPAASAGSGRKTNARVFTDDDLEPATTPEPAADTEDVTETLDQEEQTPPAATGPDPEEDVDFLTSLMTEVDNTPTSTGDKPRFSSIIEEARDRDDDSPDAWTFPVND